MVLIFVALKAESHPIRVRLSKRESLHVKGLTGDRGRIAGVPVALIRTGMGIRRSRSASRRVMDLLPEVDTVLIAGVAGALRDDLVVGQVVVGDRLLHCADNVFRAEQVIHPQTQTLGKLTTALVASRMSYAIGPMMTSRLPLLTRADKQRAFAQSGGAISVDMESAAIALEAERRGLPFVCMRTILDRAGEDVVGARILDQNGRIRPLMAAKELVTQPRTIIGVAHLVRNLRVATRSLASAIEAVLPHLATN
jgi:adenosylhomocysteine nucleosidase